MTSVHGKAQMGWVSIQNVNSQLKRHNSCSDFKIHVTKTLAQRLPLAIFWNTGAHLRITRWSCALQAAPYSFKKREMGISSTASRWHSKNLGWDVAETVLKLFYKMKNYKSKCKHFAEMHPVQSLLLEHRLCSAGGLPAAFSSRCWRDLFFRLYCSRAVSPCGWLWASRAPRSSASHHGVWKSDPVSEIHVWRTGFSSHPLAEASALWFIHFRISSWV